MRIRRSAKLSSSDAAVAAAASSSSSSSTSPSRTPSSSFSSPSSYSSCFSSTHSTIFTHSLPSSSNSTSLSISNSPTHSPIRCEGLDLLVKAVYYVAGSVVGVPYIQRRVIRRRKRAIRFSNSVVRGFLEVEDGGGGIKEKPSENNNIKNNNQRKNRRKKTNMGLTSKCQDSVLHQWQPPRSRKRRSGKIEAGSKP